MKMQRELFSLEEKYWQLHYNQSNYKGNWSTLQLRSINGGLENNIAIHSEAMQENMEYKNTSLLQNCPYIKSVLDFFEMEKLSVRLMKLNAGAIIKEHSDHNLSFEDGEIRIHIPISTNPDVVFYIDNEPIHMMEGSCWYINLGLRHRVDNLGHTDRVHLVIDGIVNEWVKTFFNSDVHTKKVLSDDKPKSKFNPDESLKIIEALRLMGTDIGNRLADEMEIAVKKEE